MNNPAVRPQRAAVYARYSSELQRAASIEDQARNCRRRAEAEGWQVSAEFSDAAISGSDASRPQYQRMLEAAARREFEILLIDDLSRLARDSVEQERTIRRLEFQGIRIVTTSDGYDSTSKARKGFWTGGRPYGYRLRPILDGSQHDQYGQPKRIGTKLEIDPEQAEVVRDIFARFAEGSSYRSIAAALNALGVPSPGSTWNRKMRRCAGWMGSAVRTITRNALYGGHVRWNANAYIKDPDSGIPKRRARPKSEWLEYQDEALRIVSDELLARARARVQKQTSTDDRLRSGGKPRFLLSGLLRCSCCGSHYIISNQASYACSGFLDGACQNNVRVRRDRLESTILDPIRQGVLAPANVERMATELQEMFAAQVRARAERAEQRPLELEQLDARIDRLRERLRAGDPDLTADELEGAIAKAIEKRGQLESQQPEAKRTATVLAALPRAAAQIRQQINLGLDGDPRAALKARVFLREAFCGKITLVPGSVPKTLWAEYSLQPAVLVRKAVGVGTDGGP